MSSLPKCVYSETSRIYQRFLLALTVRKSTPSTFDSHVCLFMIKTIDMDLMVRVLAGFKLASLNGVQMNEMASQVIGDAVGKSQ